MTVGMTRPACVLAGCERHAHTDLPWCVSDFRRLPPDLRTAYVRAFGRREQLVDGAMAELQVARDAADAWFEQHPAEAAEDGAAQ